MIETIKREVRLAGCLKRDYENPWLEDEKENPPTEREKLRVTIDASLQDTDYVAIKVDDYYNDLRLKNTPSAVDFLVTVDCLDNRYALYLLELRNVKKPEYLRLPKVQNKFSNTLSKFMEDTFSGIFCNDRFKYRRIRLSLVSNDDVIQKVKDSLLTDAALSVKPFSFRGRPLTLKFDSSPNPLIRRIT